PYDGASAYGPTYRPPFEVRALVAQVTKLHRTREGVQVVSVTQVIAEPGLDCPAESRITLPDGRITKALSVAHHTAPGLPVPQSTEVTCE
ncbi:hypothetical protein J7E90_33020, partial [Streptomyces sp. ISL-111]|uniref:hypothetical protein n=1 Tax=Streptomyces sp. ISL-111 TaxID=2819175 RepID=UPI001BEAAF5B